MQNSKFCKKNAVVRFSRVKWGKMNAKLKIQKKSPQLWWGEILVIFNHASGAKILHIEFRSLTYIGEAKA